MEVAKIREQSLAKAEGLGYRTNPSLPVLDASIELRPIEDVANRALALHAVIATSCGFPTADAIAWIQQHNLFSALSLRESEFLYNPGFEHALFQKQIESLWAFAWAFGYIPTLDFAEPCGDNLVNFYPDLQKNEDDKQWRSLIRMRSTSEIVAACDLAYCLHWAINQGRIDGKFPKSRLHPLGVIERHRALEWISGSTSWDDVDLDT